MYMQLKANIKYRLDFSNLFSQDEEQIIISLMTDNTSERHCSVLMYYSLIYVKFQNLTKKYKNILKKFFLLQTKVFEKKKKF